jgi:hypothetical protein
MQLHAVHTQACAKITYIANAIFIKYTAVLFDDGNKMANWPIENDNSDQKNRDNNTLEKLESFRVLMEKRIDFDGVNYNTCIKSSSAAFASCDALLAWYPF